MMHLFNKEYRVEKKKLKREVQKRKRNIVIFIKELTFVPEEIRKTWIHRVKSFQGTNCYYDGWLKRTLINAPFNYDSKALWNYEYIQEIDDLDIDGYFNSIIRLRILKEGLKNV